MKIGALIGHVIIALVLLYMTYLQFNDPDPLYWVVVYGFVALFPIARLFDRNIGRAAPVTFGIILAGLLIAWPGFVDYLQSGDYASLVGAMSPDKPYVEPAREFLGLVIAGAALIPYWRDRSPST